MSILQFVLAGDLNESQTPKLQNPQALFQEKCHPNIIIVRQDKKETKIGRENISMPPDYTLESAIGIKMISRKHVTIEQLSKGSYFLYDHSLNGTYVNYCRVKGGKELKNDDIVCFGHINGADIKPGETVAPFSTDLKYRVEIIDQKEDNGIVSDSSDNEPEPKVYIQKPVESRKRVKVKPDSDQSLDSSDSYNMSKEPKRNNIINRKRAVLSSSSDEDIKKTSKMDHQFIKKVVPGKPRKHSFPQQSGRISDSSRKKNITLESPSQGVNYSKKSIETKTPKHAEDRREKEKKLHIIQKSNSKSKYYETKTLKKNKSEDYEECSARSCMRPDGENLIDWIMCDKCNQWFHQFCVGLDEAVEDDESYYCPYCTHK